MKRLFMSKIHRPPLSLARLKRLMTKPGRAGKIAVCVGTVTNDTRIREFPKTTVSHESSSLFFSMFQFIGLQKFRLVLSFIILFLSYYFVRSHIFCSLVALCRFVLSELLLVPVSVFFELVVKS